MRQVRMLIIASIISVLFAGTVFAADTSTGQNKNSYKKEPSSPAKKPDVKPRKDVAKPVGKQSSPTETVSGISKKQHEDAQKIVDNTKD